MSIFFFVFAKKIFIQNKFQDMNITMREREERYILGDFSVEQTSLRYVFLLFLVYVGSLLVTALVAPWVQNLIYSLDSSYHFSATAYILRKPFSKVFDRVRWLPLLAGVLWLFKKNHLFSWKRLGLSRENRELFFPFFVLAVLLAFGIIFLQLRAFSWEWKSVSYGSLFTKLLLSSFLVAFLEEIVFRGLVLRIFYTATTPSRALIWTSLFFAYVHFKAPASAGHFFGGDLTLSQGLWTAWGFLFGVFSQFNWVSFCSLFALGLLLGELVYRYNSLWPSVGFHTGIVVLLLGYRKGIQMGESSAFLGSNNLIDSPLVAILLLVLTLYFYVVPARHSKS